MKNIESYPKTLQTAITDIIKDFGEGSIFRLGASDKLKVETIPFEILGLDRALGGGLPKGRVIEIFGPESSGKTTVCLEAIAAVQKRNKTAAFVDVEHALDPGYAKKLDVNLDKLLVSQPNSGEEALNIVDILCKGGVDLIILDSVAALVTKQELQGEIGDAVVGAQARLMSAALRKLTASISKHGTICIFTNQIREKIGVMFGNPETTPGGKALKFYASIRMDIRRSTALKTADGTVYGNRTKVKIVKNKVAPPYRECEFEIHYGSGISKAASLLEEAIKLNVISKRGSWIEYNGSMLGQGTSAAIKAIAENEALFTQLYNQLIVQEGDLSPLPVVAPVAPVVPIVAPVVAPIVAPVAPIVAPVAPVAPIVAPVAPIVAPVAPVAPVVEFVADPIPEIKTEDDDMPPDIEDEDEEAAVPLNTEINHPALQIPSIVSASQPATTVVQATVKEAIVTYLKTVTNDSNERTGKSPSQIAEAVSSQFPNRDIKALKNQVSVTVSTGAKKGIFVMLQPGMYQLP